MYSLIYLSLFNLLYRLLTSDPFELPDFLYQTSSQNPLEIFISGSSGKPRSLRPIYLDLFFSS